MPDQRHALIWVGLGLLGAGVVFGILEGVTRGGVFGGFSGTFVFFGIVILLIAAFRGRGARQQQQQQVVVVVGGGATAGPGVAPSSTAAQVRCPNCRTLNALQAGFCGECGAPIGPAPKAVPGRPAVRGTGTRRR